MGGLAEIVAAVRLTDTQLQVGTPDPGGAPLLLDRPIAAARARRQLTAHLYARFYARDPGLLADEGPDRQVRLGLCAADPGFLRALRAANPGRGYWSGGWTVTRVAAGVSVERDGLTLVVDPVRHLPPDRRQVGVGDRVAIRFPKDSTMGAPGFYAAFADRGPVRPGTSMTRVYLNLRPEAAVAVTGALLRALGELDLPFSYKVRNDPREFRRRDTAVVYVARADLDVVLPRIVAVAGAAPEAFEDPVPMFTRRVRPGVATADNPEGPAGVESSFGEHRCATIADALIALAESGPDPGAGPWEWLAAVRSHLDTRGLDPDRLHLATREAPDHRLPEG